MARLPDPLDTLTPEAKRVYAKITAKRALPRQEPEPVLEQRRPHQRRLQ